MLSPREPELLASAKLIGQFVDDAGKESAAKRDRLRLAVSLAEEFYRAALLNVTTGQASGERARCARRCSAPATGCQATKRLRACFEVCLDAYGHIDANVNQATLIEWWLDELGQAARRVPVAG